MKKNNNGREYVIKWSEAENFVKVVCKMCLGLRILFFPQSFTEKNLLLKTQIHTNT